MKLILGPCQIEDEDSMIRVAEEIQTQTILNFFSKEIYFKSSFDKANRSSANSKRGPGMEEGLRILEKVKKESGLPVLTDVHECHQIKPVAEVVDVIQIPAFLSRQTDLIQSAYKTGKIVNVKKGQFMAPLDVENIIHKCQDYQGQSNSDRVWITERGVTHGYNSLVVDFAGIQLMRRRISNPVIFDATHSVQRPGANGQSSGGDRSLVPGLVRAAVAQGIDGIFMEVHPDPDNAPSDGPNALDLKDLGKVLSEIKALMEYEWSQ